MSTSIPSDSSDILAVVREYLEYSRHTQTLLTNVVSMSTEQDRRVSALINRTFNHVNTMHRFHPSLPTPPTRPIPPPVRTAWTFTPSLSPVSVRPTETQIVEATQVLLFRELTDPTKSVCPITQESFGPNDIIIQISHCHHNFRPAALRTWFERATHCPLCRFDIRDHTPDYSPEVTGTQQSHNVAPDASPIRSVFTASNRDDVIHHLSEAVASDLTSRLLSDLSFSTNGSPLSISYSFLSSLRETGSNITDRENQVNDNEDVQ